jgi:hypothetical protein
MHSQNPIHTSALSMDSNMIGVTLGISAEEVGALLEL